MCGVHLLVTEISALKSLHDDVVGEDAAFSRDGFGSNNFIAYDHTNPDTCMLALG